MYENHNIRYSHLQPESLKLWESLRGDRVLPTIPLDPWNHVIDKTKFETQDFLYLICSYPQDKEIGI